MKKISALVFCSILLLPFWAYAEIPHDVMSKFSDESIVDSYIGAENSYVAYSEADRTPSSIRERLSHKTFKVVSYRPGYFKDLHSGGSAVGIEHAGNRYLVTAAHVVRVIMRQRPHIYARNWLGKIFPCNLVAVDDRFDLAVLLPLDPSMIDASMIVSSSNILNAIPSSGLPVYSAGYYHTDPIVAPRTIINHFRDMTIGGNWMENISTITKKSPGGFSGGGVFTTDGTLVCIMVASSVTSEEFSSCSASTNVINILRRIR